MIPFIRITPRPAALALALAGGWAGTAGTVGAQATEPTPRVTLEGAIASAMRVDPLTVSASGQVATAVWSQRAARASLFLPSLSVAAEATSFSAPAMNIGTLRPATRVVSSYAQASYDLFLGGRKLSTLRRASTEVASAEAAEIEARFVTRRAATADYYGVVTARELHQVALDRVRRAEEQLAVARSRVKLGAAVPTDSLQVVLELTRARVELLERESALDVAGLQLGRRIGMSGPADVAAVDTTVPAPLSMTVQSAIASATEHGPAFAAARAQERAAGAALSAERAAYLPKVSLTAVAGSFDERFFPRAAYRSQVGVMVSLPVWDNGARELAITQARVGRDVAQARRDDLERGAAQAVTAAHSQFTTARAGVDLAATGVAVARETYRVQDVRYRAGATTILDVLEAQGALSRAEADLVQARQRARLALADLETILGQRLILTGNSDND